MPVSASGNEVPDGATVVFSAHGVSTIQGAAAYLANMVGMTRAFLADKYRVTYLE